MNKKRMFVVLCLLVAVCMFAANVSAGMAPKQIPDPDGKPADMSKPVQVYILLGQSNMVGAGKVKGEKDGTLENAVKNKGLYPYLVDDAGNWTTCKDVRNVRVMQARGSMKLFNNEFMSITGIQGKEGRIQGKIGPEYGIGYVMGHVTDAPVMILKSCIGNRALGWDLLPPGSERFEFDHKDRKTGEVKTYIHAGYKDSPDKWEKGTEPKKIGWYAGKQYDDDTRNAKKVLAELDKYYPGAKGYEIAGFFWWQGARDAGSAALSQRYEQNLVHLIKYLRKDFNAPKAKFVLATLGHHNEKSQGNDAVMLKAMKVVDGKKGKYPEFKGNVATVYSNPLSKGGSANGHYGGNAETYMNVGEAMGWAMAELIAPKSCCSSGTKK